MIAPDISRSTNIAPEGEAMPGVWTWTENRKGEHAWHLFPFMSLVIGGQPAINAVAVCEDAFSFGTTAEVDYSDANGYAAQPFKSLCCPVCLAWVTS